MAISQERRIIVFHGQTKAKPITRRITRVKCIPDKVQEWVQYFDKYGNMRYRPILVFYDPAKHEQK